MSLRERLFIKPVLVNRHLLREGERTSQAIYRMPGGEQTRKQFFGSYVNAVKQAGINYWEMPQAQLAREGAVAARSPDGPG